MATFTELDLQEAKKEIIRAQIERFHEFYFRYFNQPETLRMVQFFFEKVYNMDGAQEWIEIAYSGFDKVKSMIKESTRESMEQLMELHQITDELDKKMAELLLKKGWKPGTQISRQTYDELFQEMGEAELRAKQLKYVLRNLTQFYELAHRPINSVILKPVRFMSKVLGIYPLFAIVEEGYYACLTVSLEIFQAFYKEVEIKEWDYLFKMFPHLQNSQN